MNLLKTFVAASAIALASFGANASQITSGGVTWDPDFESNSSSDFSAIGYYEQYYVAGTARNGINVGDKITDFSLVSGGDSLQGFGYIADMNGQDDSEYCVTCSSLTFTFTDFLLADLTEAGSPIFTGGSAAVYADTGTEATTYSEASDGLLWLELAAVVNPGAGDGVGSTLDVGGTVVGGTNANAFFDVVGGSVMSNFDTNEQFFGSDLAYNSFRLPTGDSILFLKGNSIPEPTSLAIFGLALLGLAGAARRKA